MDEIVGYKWLAQYPDGTLVSPVAAYFEYVPIEQATWVDGHLEAHKIPVAEYGLKRFFYGGNNYGVDNYIITLHPGIHAHKSIAKACSDGNNTLFHPDDTIMILVKVLLSGVVVEGETGYRAQYADIVEIVDNREYMIARKEIWNFAYDSFNDAMVSSLGNLRDSDDDFVCDNFSNCHSYSVPFTDGIQRIHQIYLAIKEENHG